MVLWQICSNCKNSVVLFVSAPVFESAMKMLRKCSRNVATWDNGRKCSPALALLKKFMRNWLQESHRMLGISSAHITALGLQCFALEFLESSPHESFDVLSRARSTTWLSHLGLCCIVRWEGPPHDSSINLLLNARSEQAPSYAWCEDYRMGVHNTVQTI